MCCLRYSWTTQAVARLTLSELLLPCIGILTTSPARLRASGSRPSLSLPIRKEAFFSNLKFSELFAVSVVSRA